MKNQSKGRAYIFNHEKFHETLKKDERKNTKNDCNLLKETLQNFKIDVEVFNNLTTKELSEKVTIVKNENFSTFECLIIAILTHGKGDNGNILHSFDGEYNFYDDIVHPIINNNATLIVKPKIFIIQTSKGIITEIVDQNIERDDIISGNNIESPTTKIPTTSEMYITVSSHEDKGTFVDTDGQIKCKNFIEIFCKNLLTHGKKYPIEGVMQFVALNFKEENIPVTPTNFTTMTKPFIFGEIGNKFKRNKLGYCIIFNLGQMKFNRDILTQCGTRKDVEIIKEMCNKYKITVWDDKQNEIKQTLQQITDTVNIFKSFDFTEFDFLIIPIITFVSDHDLIHAHDSKFNLYDTIIEPIYNNETLKGKPIVILVEALKFPIDIKFNIPIPDLKNMYFAFSTYDGYHDVNLNFFGGVFLHKLCKEIDNTGHIKSINEIMESVTEELCIASRPILKNTLTKQFFLGNYVYVT